jgi:hypothetical protein
MRHDIDSCDQDDEDQDDAWLDGPVVKVKGKSRLRSEGQCDGEAWARLGADGPVQREEQAKSRSMDRDGHVMIWIGSCLLEKQNGLNTKV